jgi:negative regulator of flagellin synthesis FlgM
MAVNNINGIPGPQTPRTGEGSKAGKAQPGRGEGVSQKTQGGEAPSADMVTLTDTAARLRKLESTLSGLPEIDNGRVADVQRAIADGSYEINAGKIADKLLDLEAAFSKGM